MAKRQGTLDVFVGSKRAKAAAAIDPSAAKEIADRVSAEAKAKEAERASSITSFTELESTLEPSWSTALAPEFAKPYWKSLIAKLETDRKAGHEIFPPMHQVFNAFQYCPLDQVKVVILGQDPYHDNNQAHGLCFSVQEGNKAPPSLKNIYKELEQDPDVKFSTPANAYGNLEAWVSQGVLLLNAVLTVKAHNANSHKTYGWATFTDAVVAYVNKHTTGTVFLLWGKDAQVKAKSVDKAKHHVLTAGHPSPLSIKHFMGCRHFSKCNQLLIDQGKAPIDWQVGPPLVKAAAAQKK